MKKQTNLVATDLEAQINNYKNILSTLPTAYSCEWDDKAETFKLMYEDKYLPIVPIDDEETAFGFLLSRNIHRNMKINDLKKIGFNIVVECRPEKDDLFDIIFTNNSKSLIAKTKLFMPEFDKGKKEKLVEYLDKHKSIIPENAKNMWVDKDNTETQGLSEIQLDNEEIEGKIKTTYYPDGHLDICVKLESPNNLGEIIDIMENHTDSIYKILE